MIETVGSTLRGRASAEGRWDARFRLAVGALPLQIGRAFDVECEHRRLFLWLPVAFGAGIVLYFTADREPPFWLCAGLFMAFAVAACATRAHRAAFIAFVALAACLAGMMAAEWRTLQVAAPVLDRIRIVDVEGYIEEMDFRPKGARFILRVSAADGIDADKMPYRIRLTTTRAPPFEAGAYVETKARLLPPSQAAEPGGYDFARDAWFERIGAVGNVLGHLDLAEAPEPPDAMLAAGMALDRGRNALARRVDAIVGGDAGAIAAAMVTGKRDLLSEDAKSLIREAGIFHVITISGVQMTLVAGIFFVGLRRLLAMSPRLALQYPIKKWAAAAAILAAIFYDIATGSRIGAERALFMTIIMLAAVLLDRHAFSMRNLAFAALAVLLFEPDAVLGASFQLSFAAVGALVAVYEARAASRREEDRKDDWGQGAGPKSGSWKGSQSTSWFGRRGHGFRAALFATLCASSATAAFMAADFHEMNPYVLIGNPLTLAIIELFAVPGALLGTALYPFGLDAFVWHYVGLGIAIIMAAARFVSTLPGSSLHLPAFAPWSLVFFALAVLSVVIWRTLLFRATAIPLALIGLAGAASGAPFDIAVGPLGDAAAVRLADGQLAILGERPSAFAAEQWLRADADGRVPKSAFRKSACDRMACIGRLADGRTLSLVFNRAAFAEDCRRATILVTPLFAPKGCAAPIVIDRESLRRTGAVTLRATKDGATKDGAIKDGVTKDGTTKDAAMKDGPTKDDATTNGFTMATARAPGEDRPWSPAPKPRWGEAAPKQDDAEPDRAVSSDE